MKTSVVHILGFIALSIFSFAFLPIEAQDITNDYVSISGVVKSNKSKKALEGVNISVPGSNLGTITNEDGAFTLKVKNVQYAKEIKFSHLGYKNAIIKLDKNNLNHINILLIPKANYLNEVVVIGMNPSSIILEAMKNISTCYNHDNSMLTGFYRETAQKKNKYISISEAVIDIYKTSYNNSIDNDRIAILKGRKLLSPKLSDTLGVKLMGGPYLSIIADIVKNRDSFLSPETMGYYNFRMLDPEMIDNREQYVIDFEPKFKSFQALYNGKIFVDKEKMTFSRVEFALMMDNKQLAIEQMLYKKPFGLKFKPLELSCIVSYKSDDGISRLNYIKNEIRFKCDWKKKLFATGYRVVSEMVVTDVNNNNVKPIPYRKTFGSKDTFNDKLSEYADGDFWGSYNIIEPSESLEKAVDKLKKK